MEIEGTIIRYLGRQSGTSKAGNPWKKDEYVLETPGTYPKQVKFTIFGEKCEDMKCEVGKSYILSVDIESREFNERWYTDVNCYARRESGQSAESTSVNTGNQPVAPGHDFSAAPAQPTFEAPVGDASDDLPF